VKSRPALAAKGARPPPGRPGADDTCRKRFLDPDLPLQNVTAFLIGAGTRLELWPSGACGDAKRRT